MLGRGDVSMETFIGALVVAVVNVVGGGLVIRWLVRQIEALKGTVDAQDKTLKTIGQVNQTLVEVFKTMDPERWAKEVQIHKQLADEKARAIVDQERQKLADEWRQMAQAGASAERTLRLAESAVDRLSDYAFASATLLQHIPKGLRDRVIDDLQIKDDIKSRFRTFSVDVPDLSPAAQFMAAVRTVEIPGTLPANIARHFTWAAQPDPSDPDRPPDKK